MTRWLAWSLTLATLVSVVLDTVVVSVTTSLWSVDAYGLHGWPLVDLAALGCAVLGTVIVATYPRHVIGWLLVVAGLTTAVSLLTESYSLWVLDEGGPGSAGNGHVAAWVSLALGGPFTLCFLGLIFLVVPDGHLLTARWRPVAWMLVTGGVLSFAGIVMTSPDDVDTTADATGGPVLGQILSSVGILTTSVGLVLAVVSMVVRLRRSHGEARQQLRWVVTAAIFVACALTTVLAGQLASGGHQSPLTSVPLFASYAVLVGSIAVSVLRFRLYDLDLIISRAVLLAGATAFVTAAYVLLVVVVGDRLDGDTETFWLSLAITAIISLAFQPLRRWVVHLADRLAYGPRARPYDALADFSRRAGDSPAPDQLLPAVAEAAGRAAGAIESAAHLDLPDGTVRDATWTSASSGRRTRGDSVDVPVADASGRLGAIRVLLPAGRDLRRHEQRLLHDIADQAAVAFGNLRLEVDLAVHVEELDRQTAELAASRGRLVRASDSERHRLEVAIGRDVLSRLHDLRADLAGLPPEGPTSHQVESMIDEATAALETLRDLTKGLHPTLLTRAGLAPALTSYVARSGTATVLSVDPVAAPLRWPDRVEAVAYFCTTQAVSLGTPCTATVWTPSPDVLGIDLVDPALGSDVRQSIVDRVEALGGTVQDVSGTVVIRLPRWSDQSVQTAR